MNGENPNLRRQISRSFGRLLVVVVGLLVGQTILYWPSLVGQKILLPLDILATQNHYLPMTSEVEKIVPHDPVLVDLVFQFEPARRFAVSELREGRFPLWAPYEYAGAPFVWPKFSPFLMLQYSTASPIILAWAQVFAAVVAGLGAYLFFKQAMGISFWPSAITAWCYPLTGFLIFWQGYPTCGSVYWLPWLLLAVDRTIRCASLVWAAGLSVTTALVLVSGHIDVAGQVLLGSGFYAVWCLLDEYRKQWFQRRARSTALTVMLGWLLGFLLAAPHILPLVEYARTGLRAQQRAAGKEERPPVGLSALPLTVLPDMYGTTRAGSYYMLPTNQIETSAATYVGVVATLLVAPLAWCSRRHKSFNLFWLLLIFFALSWCLNVPGLVQLLRLPGLNMMSHNRLVFLASFAILAMAAIGLEVLLRGEVQRRRWFWLPSAILAALCFWCFHWADNLPEPVATLIESKINRGDKVGWIQDISGVRQMQAWFVQSYTISAALCALGISGWLLVWILKTRRPWLLPVLGVVMVGDLLWFAHDRGAQCDPALYYPRIPMLEEIAKSPDGRITGINCLPPSLSQSHGLHDIRGYDSIDPARYVELLAMAANTEFRPVDYAWTQNFSPEGTYERPDKIHLPPILDMLGVRYVVFRGTPPSGFNPPLQSFDYWALINNGALPRVFVPMHVEVIGEDSERLKKLSSTQFNAREVAYVETPVDLPERCDGTAEIVAEVPTQITIAVQMETPGLVVLADLWDKGWQAYLDGRRMPVLRANHAIRGVVVYAGKSTLEFRYRPASLILGLWMAGFAASILLVTIIGFLWKRRQ